MMNLGSVFKPSGPHSAALTGISMILCANFIFSFIDTGSKWLALFGLPALQLAFMRYAGHFAISIAIFGRNGFNTSAIYCNQMPLVIIRAFCLMLATALNFFAIRYLSLSLTSTILFSAPLIVCALSWPLLKEPVGLFRWSAILLGFGGIVIAIQPFDAEFHWAVFLSITGAISFAFYSLLTRKLADQVDANNMQFWSGFIGTFTLLPFAMISWQNPQDLFQWLVLLSLGVSGWSGHQLMTNALKHAPANLLLPFGYSFILYLTIWSYFVFDEIPDFWTIIGAMIVVAAGLIIWLREKHLSEAAKRKR